MYVVYNKINNNLLADIFYIVEGSMLIVYYYLLFHEKEFLLPGLILLVSFIAFGLYTTFVDPGMEAYNSTFRTGESLIIQALSAYSLIRISKDPKINLVKNPQFWISASFFIYFSVNVAIFFTATFFYDNSTVFMSKTWGIHSIVNILANLIFTFAMYLIPNPKSK